MSQDQLLQQAISAANNAYAPYSKYKVGAAIRLLTPANAPIYSGCNIENASYGGTVCAERVAIWKAVSENPGVKLAEVVVFTDQEQPWPPCGLCRQVIAEFADPDTKISIANLKGVQKTYSFAELFPSHFGPEHL